MFHLGNVLTVVSDRKIAVDSDNNGTTDYFLPDVVSATDYYAFGGKMPGRQFNSNSARYQFNGKEYDQETGTQDYSMRIYNPNLGKFLSVDPLTKEYPWNSTYAFAENDVIRSVDIDGLEKSYRYFIPNNDGSYTMIKEVKYKELFPGEEFGSKGSGHLDYYYDNKVKKFGEGQYRESYEDANPIRSTLQNLEYRYRGEKGLKNAVEDYPNAAKGVAVLMMIGGAVTGQPEVTTAGIEVYGIADNVGNGAKIVEAGVDVAEGNYTEGVVKAVGVGADYFGGKLVKPITNGDKVLEATGTVATDQVVEKITDNTEKMATPDNLKE